MISYWESSKWVRQIIHTITPKFNTFTCIATKAASGDWIFSKWFVKDEPFTYGTDFAIDTIYTEKKGADPQVGDKVSIKVSTIKPDKYDTTFINPEPTECGYFYTDTNTMQRCFVCDVAQVFFKGVPYIYYISIEPNNVTFKE